MSKLRVVGETAAFWAAVRGAAYEVAFTDKPWQYQSQGAGRFWGMREFFRRLGPAMQCYALQRASLPHTPQPTPSDDRVNEATRARAAALEID